MIAVYYDIQYKYRFAQLFKGTAIYENPTEEQGQYLVLSLNFSQISTDHNKTKGSFVNHVRDLVVDFIQKYSGRLSTHPKLKYYSKNIEISSSAADIFSSLMVLARGVNQSLYIIIDEYDNFANTILTGPTKTGVFSLDLSKYGILIGDMAYDGKWRPLLEFITRRMKESLARRDLINGEKAVQTFLNVYLGLSDLLIVHSEKEMNMGYADLLLQPHKMKYPELNHSFLLELKYQKTGMKQGDPTLVKLVADAEAQLKNYAKDEVMKKAVGNTQLIKLVLIFSGHKVIHLGEVNELRLP